MLTRTPPRTFKCLSLKIMFTINIHLNLIQGNFISELHSTFNFEYIQMGSMCNF